MLSALSFPPLTPWLSCHFISSSLLPCRNSFLLLPSPDVPSPPAHLFPVSPHKPCSILYIPARFLVYFLAGFSDFVLQAWLFLFDPSGYDSLGASVHPLDRNSLHSWDGWQILFARSKFNISHKRLFMPPFFTSLYKRSNSFSVVWSLKFWAEICCSGEHLSFSSRTHPDTFRISRRWFTKCSFHHQKPMTSAQNLRGINLLCALWSFISPGVFARTHHWLLHYVTPPPPPAAAPKTLIGLKLKASQLHQFHH